MGKELYPCPYCKATTCNLEDPCMGCEVFSEHLNGETTPRIKLDN